jgi:DNA-binding MarR family transcriptional regulator
MKADELELGGLLRALIASLDDGVQELYRNRGEGFRPRYYPVVRLLMVHDTLRVGELARRCGVSQPAMTQTLDAMRKDGIVQSIEGSDHRERLVSLTAQGRSQAMRLKEVWLATARAAARLESECEISITDVARAYLAALEGRPFIERIREELE